MVVHARTHWADDEFEDEGDWGVEFLTEEEAYELFDRQAHLALGISGEEFLQRWDAGEIPPVPDTPEGRPLGHLVMMIPFGRRTKA
jgi:hypothetical protein